MTAASKTGKISHEYAAYGTSNTTVFVSSNGLMSFGTGNSEYVNQDMTSDPTQAAIAPYWDDQYVHSPGRIFYQVLGSGPIPP